MKYHKSLNHVFAMGYVKDGYFGDSKQVKFAFDPESGKTMVVHELGFYNSGLPPASDVNEAIWLLKNHPLAKAINADPECEYIIYS
mgnify:CR=1 FL=1|jgi:hypothetical protein